MKKLIICLYILLAILLLPGCSRSQPSTVPQIEAPSPGQLAPERPIDWSQVNLPAVGEEGKWVLTPGMGHMVNAAFSADGKTIYGLGSNSLMFLRKSSDGGRSWVMLPAFEELGLWEAFWIEVVNDELFIGCARGVYHSSDGGQTFDELPHIPGGIWGMAATADASGKPVIMAFTDYGLRMLGYPYQNWIDMRVGNVDGGSGRHFVWQMAFSPNYAEDGQIMALIGDEEHLRVSFKYGDEAWGERIADAYIPDNETYCDLRMAFSQFAFPDDYDSQNPVIFIGTGLYTELLCQTPQYADLYRIDGRSADSGFSIATDLDVGGKGTSTPIYSVVVKGAADAATILAGSVGQVYRSTDGGQTWQVAKKPPTGGAIFWMAFDPSDEGSSLVYALSLEAGNCLVPRGTDVPVRESAFSYSADGGVAWNQVSQIDTRIDEIIDQAVSPDYNNDETMFMLTSSRHMLTVSLTEDEMVYVTREPDEPGVTAKVYITPHQANPPVESMWIDNGDPSITRKDWSTGTGPALVLDDEYPNATIKVLPLTERGILELVDMVKEWYPGYTDPWYAQEWLALTQQPRQVVIFITEGSVTVTKGEAIEERISVDGDASDWQDIEPLATDPEGDAPSEDEDMKALYVTNDSGYLYLMVEFYGQNPRSHCDILVDLDLDGSWDHNINIASPDEPFGPYIGLWEAFSTECLGNGVVAFGQVLEARLPLEVIGVERLGITQINIAHGLDNWEDSLEVKIEEFAAASAPTPSSLPIPFPSTESLWKTTDGGTTWERILTSGLNLLVGGKQVKVGLLDSVALSINFAQDNTIYVYEGGDSSRVWVSTDGGMTFVLCK